MATASPSPSAAAPVLGRHPAPASQWRLVDLYERMEPGEAGSKLRDMLSAELTFAHESLSKLERWPLVPKQNYDRHAQGSNHVRARRVLDFVTPGDRLLDIGTNYGYLSGILLRERNLSYYCGIDLADHQLASVAEMVEVNGLQSTPLQLERRNLYDIKKDFVDTHRPDLILLLEVLEHVDDPGLALKTLSQAISSDTSILFSVPLLGRLEGCWGHRGLFDHRRILRLCEEAGLYVHHVEPLHNVWALALVSPEVTRSARAIRAEAAAWPIATRPPAGSYELAFVGLSNVTESKWCRRLDNFELERERGAVRCKISPSAEREAGQYGGIRVGIDGLSLARLELSFTSPEQIVSVFADASDADGKRLGRWSWQRDESSPPLPDGQRVTCVLRPGSAVGLLEPDGGFRNGDVAALDVFVRVIPGGETGFALHRLAYAA